MRSYEFDEGYNAFIMGKGMWTNPYLVGSEEFDLWEEGYFTAESAYIEASLEIEYY